MKFKFFLQALFLGLFVFFLFSCTKVTQNREKLIIPSSALGPRSLVERHISIPKNFSWNEGQVIILKKKDKNISSNKILYISREKALEYVRLYKRRNNRNLVLLDKIEKIIQWNID